MSEHVHSYIRNEYNKEVYRCNHPQCHSYNLRKNLINKESACPKCGDRFIMTRKQLVKMNVKIPVCVACSRSPKKEEVPEFNFELPMRFE